MNTPMTVVWHAPEVAEVEKKKRVLLLDISTHTRELRAEVMRRLGIDVDCAADISEARSWWKAGLYDLVLIDMENGSRHRAKFCEDMRDATPRQRLAFLVGEPQYLADFPNDDAASVSDSGAQSLPGNVKVALSVDASSRERWGILEASRRIAAVRLTCNARSRAVQDGPPTPPRDSDARTAKRTPSAWNDLVREEMQ